MIKGKPVRSIDLKTMISSPAYSMGRMTDLGTATELPEGRLSVDIDGCTIESFFLKNEASPYLFILFSGARDPSKHPLPKFDRWSWEAKFDASILCISDPTLELDRKNLNIGWYLGTENADYLTHIGAWVSFVSSRLGIPTERIVSYGSSAGGFASIMLASRLKKATAIAINPQLDVFKYYPKFVDQYFDLAFPGKDKSTIRVALPHRFSAIHAIRTAPNARFIVAQNIQDKFHFSKHFGSLIKELGVPATDDLGRFAQHANVSTILFDSPNGHGSEPLDIVPVLVNKAKTPGQLIG